MLTEEEMTHIAEMMADKIEKHEPVERAKHNLKRRGIIVVVVLVTGVIGHKLIEIPGVAEFAQSFELVLAAAIEYAFSKAKEIE
jgi:hypothetical protein